MMTFDNAVAAYLHRQDRPLPWARQQEEEALDGLSGWLHSAGGTVRLEDVTPHLVSRYAAERRLSAQALDELHGTLASLLHWSRTAESGRTVD